MAARTPEEHLTWYVINYFGGFMTKAEWLAHRTFMMEFKAQHGYSTELLEEADRGLTDAGYEPLRTSDPEALSLMSDGVEVFLRRVRDRILREHQDRVVLNYCPKCGGLAKTPRAQQCQWCFYVWHGRGRNPSD
jgi:hypothetical protein